jgi:hypothetical protein
MGVPRITLPSTAALAHRVSQPRQRPAGRCASREEVFLGIVNAETMALSWSYQDRLQEEAALLERQWREKLQRLEYQADLARRRYEHVDPANRRVAQTLETAWNQRLIELREAQSAHEAQRPTPAAITSTCAQMQAAVAALPELWYAEAVAPGQEGTAALSHRAGVFGEPWAEVIRARIGWYGGVASELDVPKYLFSAPHLYHRICDLARCHTDAEIAEQLNQAGPHTVKGWPWTARRVMDFRLSNAIPSGFTTTAALRIPQTGYLTSAEAARQLGVTQSTVQKWYRLGVLNGKHDGGPSSL